MKTVIKPIPTPKKLLTPTDLGDKARTAITEVVNPLIADVFAIFVKTKNFHWHVSGSHYRDYHLLLDEQAAQIFAMIDVLAERIRKLGGTTIRSIAHINHLKHISDDNDVNLSADAMLERLLKDNQLLISQMREVHDICDKYRDVATASLLENYIDESEQRVWFLYETISK
jgi:starvation-inducible DNA-binding protein